MKVCFMGVENPTNLELPLHIFTRDLPFFLFLFLNPSFSHIHTAAKRNQPVCADLVQPLSHYMKTNEFCASLGLSLDKSFLNFNRQLANMLFVFF